MENGKLMILIPVIVALFGVAIYLDSNDCKSLSDAGDILGGGKVKRLEQENDDLRKENAELRRVLRDIKKSMIEEQDSQVNVTTPKFSVKERPVKVGVIPPPCVVHEDLPKLKPITHKPSFSSNSTSNRIKPNSYSHKKLTPEGMYREQVYNHFSRVIWHNWKKHPEIRDVDMVIVKITVDRDGKVLNMNVESSASKVVTEALVNEIKAYKFKPLPSSYEKNTANFRYSFGKNSFGSSSF